MKRKNRHNATVDFGSCSIVFLMCFLWANSSWAQNPFYQDKNINIVAATDAGGTADLRIRTVVAFLRKHIPGNPNIVVEYMPGGGGRKAANHVYRTSRPDGLTMGAMLSSLVPAAVVGETGVLYDIDKVTYLGTSYSGSHHVFITRKVAGLDSLEKLRAASGVRIGAQSVGHLIYISGRLFTYLIGPKQPKFVTGYDARELDIAIERGEIDARSTVADSMLHENREWADKGLMDFHGIIEIPKGQKHTHPRFAKLPDIETFARSDMDRKLVAMYRTFVGSGNPYILPPGTPKDRVQLLQEAMRKTYRDPEFFKEYTKLTGLKAEPQMPEELEQTIKDMPRDLEAVELFKKLTGPDPLPQR